MTCDDLGRCLDDLTLRESTLSLSLSLLTMIKRCTSIERAILRFKTFSMYVLYNFFFVDSNQALATFGNGNLEIGGGGGGGGEREIGIISYVSLFIMTFYNRSRSKWRQRPTTITAAMTAPKKSKGRDEALMTMTRIARIATEGASIH